MREMEGVITIGPLALSIGVLETQLRRLANGGKIRCRRINGMRVFDLADVPEIRAACLAAGYLKSEVANAG